MDGHGARSAAWIVQGIMKTSDAVTPMRGSWFRSSSSRSSTSGLGAVVIALIRRTVLETAPARGGQ